MSRLQVLLHPRLGEYCDGTEVLRQEIKAQSIIDAEHS